MRRILIGMFSGALMVGLSVAQSNTVPMSPAPQGPRSAQVASAPRVAPGSVIPVSLSKTVDAKKVKVGDEVMAKVTQDMKSNTGEVIMAKDTKMTGHVTEAQARSKEQKESEVGIVFDKAVLKDGSSMSMPMSIQAVIGPQNNGPQSTQSSSAGGAEPTGPTTSAGGARPGMGGASPASPPASSASNMPTDTQSSTAARPPITATTQGVIGISNLTLASTAPNASQGSLLTSDKNNVKIESGTMMLLRVNR